MSIRKLFGNDDEDFNELLTKSLKIDVLGTFDDYMLNTDSSLLKLYKGNVELFEFNENYCISNKQLGVSNSNASYTLDVNGTINYTGNFYENGALKYFSPFEYNGSNIFYNTGSVGIGTQTPNSLLEVSNTNPTLFLENDDTYTSTIKLGLADNSSFSKIVNTTNYPNTSLSFFVGTSLSTTEETLRLNSDKTINMYGDLNVGNAFKVNTTTNRIGINKLNPTKIVEIGDNALGSILRFDGERQWEFNTIGSGSGTSLNLSSLNAEDKTFAIEKNNSNQVAIFKTSNTLSNQRIILCENGGNVGIGTNSPTEALQIEGGDIYVNYDTNSGGEIIPGAVGQAINVVSSWWMKNFTQFQMPSFVGGWQRILEFYYTPKSNSSWIEIMFDGEMYLGGSGTDVAYLAIFIDGNQRGTHISNNVNNNGGGCRGNNLLPLFTHYINNSTNQILISLECQLTNSNDDIYIRKFNDYSHYFYIIEYNR